jgi:nucleotide-binding universal stress UspA family protein
VVDSGEPGPAIVDSAAEADLIVMATRGDGATAALIGSTADHVARHAPVPTLLVREVAAATIRRIMVPLDGGARAEEAIPLAATMRQEFGGSVLLVRVVDPSTSIATARELKEAADAYLRQQAERIGDAETVDVEVPVLRAGTVAECLMEVAKPGDIIVMASRRRTQLAKLLLGSVAAPLIRSAPVPVVLAPGIPGHMASALHAAASGIGRSDSV